MAPSSLPDGLAETATHPRRITLAFGPGLAGLGMTANSTHAGGVVDSTAVHTSLVDSLVSITVRSLPTPRPGPTRPVSVP